MTKCSVFIATSLDGFISRTDGRMDWLERANRLVPQGEDFGYARFMASVDGIVIGRTTFEQVLTYEKWPYGTTPLVVLSRTLKSLPANLPATVSISAEAPFKVGGSPCRAGVGTSIRGRREMHPEFSGGRPDR